MSTMVTELYQALRQAGVEESLATAAAHAVWQPEQPATKTDIETVRREIAELKADLTWRMVLMTGAFIAAAGALRIFT